MKKKLTGSLLDAYLSTRYVVADKHVTIRMGAIDAELERLLESSGHVEWSFITAYNPWSEVRPDPENSIRNEMLRADILEFPYFDGEGIGEDPAWKPEQSFLVLGISRSKAIETGRKYGQHAIVVGRKGEPAELLLLEEVED